MIPTLRRLPTLFSRWLGALLTLSLLSACSQTTPGAVQGLSVESGDLQDGRHVERLNENVGPDLVQRIEVIRNAEGERQIGVAMVHQRKAPQGLITVRYDRPERCRLTSRVRELAAQGGRQESVINSSCSWLPVGTRIMVQPRLQER